MVQRQLILDLGLFETPRCGESARWSERAVFRLLEFIAAENMDVLRCGKIPPLYQAGVRWVKEPADKEIFMTIPAVLRDKGADCEDLAAWRVAELRTQGEPAGFVLYRWKFGKALGGGRALWQFSELRSYGEPSRLILYRHDLQVGKMPESDAPGNMYHVLVQRVRPGAQGWVPWFVEDPSALLGMGADSAEAQHMRRVG